MSKRTSERGVGVGFAWIAECPSTQICDTHKLDGRDSRHLLEALDMM